MLMRHIGNDTHSKSHTKHTMLSKRMRGNFQDHVCITMIHRFTQVFLYVICVRGSHMKSSIIGFSPYHCMYRRNHRCLISRSQTDVVYKRSRRRFAISASHTNNGELPTRKPKPKSRKNSNQKMIEPFDHLKHIVIIPLGRITTKRALWRSRDTVVSKKVSGYVKK